MGSDGTDGQYGRRRLVSIQEACRKVTTGGTPSRRNARFYEGGSIAWFKTGELKDCRLYDSEEHITEAALASSSAKLFPPNTVLMAMYGDGHTITSLGVLDREAATNQACCAMIADESICDWRYLFYALKGTRKQLLRVVVGGAQRNLSGRLIKEHQIPLPPLSEQRAIAEVLGSLDDKIELNRRMNRTLESMARALFKSWFIDFDPVHANAAGKPTLPPELAALFPAAFEPSPLGDIPVGWEVKTVGDVLTLHYGKSLPKKIRKPGAVAVYGSGGHTGTHDAALVNGPGIIIGRKGSVGTIYWENGDFFPIDTTYYVETGDDLTLNFAHRMLERLGLNTMNTDAAVPGLNRQNAYRLQVIVPPRDLIGRYDAITGSMRGRQTVNETEAGTLAALRNSLLPKLLTGSLRTREVAS